jgi:hypothetical protein
MQGAAIIEALLSQKISQWSQTMLNILLKCLIQISNSLQASVSIPRCSKRSMIYLQWEAIKILSIIALYRLLLIVFLTRDQSVTTLNHLKRLRQIMGITPKRLIWNIISLMKIFRLYLSSTTNSMKYLLLMGLMQLIKYKRILIYHWVPSKIVLIKNTFINYIHIMITNLILKQWLWTLTLWIKTLLK